MVDGKTEKVPFWAENHRLFWMSTEAENNPRFKALSVGGSHIVVACQPGGGLLGGHTNDVGEVLVYGKDGALVSRTDIGAEPLYDGVAISGGKLFVSTQSGGVICLN